jgi:hypothetical protein
MGRGRIAGLLVLGLLVLGCDECRKDDDCPSGQVCVNGSCRPLSGSDGTTDPETDAAADGEDAGDAAGDPDAALDGPLPDGTGDAPVDGEEEEVETPCETDEDCADDNVCTDDSCNTAFHLCENVAVDGRDCDDGDLCNGVGTCDETGACVIDSSPLCDDGNPCTFDTCVSGGSDCTHDTSAADGNTCDNGLHCDGPDECADGACVAADSSYAPCDDGDLCTDDRCAEGSSGPSCTHPSITFRGLGCGETITGVTSGASGASSYGSCTGSLGTGPEEVIVFAHTSDTDVTFTLVTDGGVPTAPNNELYVLVDGCDPSTCTRSGATSVTVTGVLAMARVHVAIESVDGGALYAVEATCP